MIDKVDDKINYRRGLKSDNASQKNAENELSRVYSKVSCSSNRVMNQKYFYSDIDFSNHKAIIVKFKTKEEIKISKEDKIKLKKYLKEKKINIKYFENFEGYINLFIFESYKEGFDYLVKGIFINFINNLLKDTRIIINIENEEDINMLIFLFKNYFKDFIVKISLQDMINLYNKKKRNFREDWFFLKVYAYKNLIEFIQYFEQYKKLLNNIYTISLIKNNKNYIYMEIKQNLNINELDNYFLYDKDVNLFYQLFKEKILNFKGCIFLFEFEIICDNQKIKRFSIFFYDLYNKLIFYFNLFDSIRIKFVLDVLNLILVNKNIDLDIDLINRMTNEINNIDIDVKNDYVFENKDIIFNKYNKNNINITNLENLIFYLNFYNLFF